jgi:hypothetical protein
VEWSPRKSPPAPVVLGASLVPEIRDLVQQSREYVAATANLALVWLYWNVGRLITIDIQKMCGAQTTAMN